MDSTRNQSQQRPLLEQIACVARELAIRKSVYPRLVEQKRMSDEKRVMEIAQMESVLETLCNLNLTSKKSSAPNVNEDDPREDR